MRRLTVALGATAVVVAACGSDSAETRATSTAPPATAAPVTADPPTTRATTIPAPTASVAVGNFADTPVIVSPNGVLGWWSGGEWIVSPADPSQVPVGGGEDYQVIELDAPVAIAQGTEAVPGCDTITGHLSIGIPPLTEPRQFPTTFPFAVSAPWELRPHVVEVLDPAPAVYVEITSELLAEQGIDDPAPNLVQVVRTDLEGDGVDELLIVAERNTSGTLNPAFVGDYSIAFLRKVVDEEVGTSILGLFEVVEPEVEGSIIDLLAYRLDGIADLNGDGTMEIVIDDQYYEGAGTRVFDYLEDGPVAVLDVGCGV